MLNFGSHSSLHTPTCKARLGIVLVVFAVVRVEHDYIARFVTYHWRFSIFLLWNDDDGR